MRKKRGNQVPNNFPPPPPIPERRFYVYTSPSLTYNVRQNEHLVSSPPPTRTYAPLLLKWPNVPCAATAETPHRSHDFMMLIQTREVRPTTPPQRRLAPGVVVVVVPPCREKMERHRPTARCLAPCPPISWGRALTPSPLSTLVHSRNFEILFHHAHVSP